MRTSMIAQLEWNNASYSISLYIQEHYGETPHYRAISRVLYIYSHASGECMGFPVRTEQIRYDENAPILIDFMSSAIAEGWGLFNVLNKKSPAA